MNALIRFFAALVLAGLASTGHAAGAATCTGRFPNLVTDICWSCVMPITVGSVTLANFGGQEDNGDNPGSPLCSCGTHPTFGLAIGFWEPARQVEAMRKPFCLASLGGIDMDPGIAAPEGARVTKAEVDFNGNSFYQAHFYKNPVIALLNAVADFGCTEPGSLDLIWLTEVDPTWADDELSLILNPDALLFANPIAIAACAADCVAASFGFGIKELFWCAGCQGGLYPLDGHVNYHMGGVRTAVLEVQRLTARMHRDLVAWGYHGPAGLCGPYYEPVMDKTAYKTQIVYPIADTGDQGTVCGAGTTPTDDNKCKGADGKIVDPSITLSESRCCHPFGRTTALWGAGKEFPVNGEDFSFMLFRKRNCCVGY